MKAWLVIAAFGAVPLALSSAIAGCSGTEASSTFDAGPDVYEAGPPVDAGTLPVFEDGGPTPTDASPEFACFSSTFRTACNTCCEQLYPTGRAVFTSAIDECVCQPSKCGTVCANSLCKVPQANPPAGDPCIKCFNDALGRNGADAGDPAANPAVDAGPRGDGGPEKGISHCPEWANAKCRADTQCLQAETCKVRARCQDKPTSSASDAGGG